MNKSKNGLDATNDRERTEVRHIRCFWQNEGRYERQDMSCLSTSSVGVVSTSQAQIKENIPKCGYQRDLQKVSPGQ